MNDEPQTKFDLALRVGDWISVSAGRSKGGRGRGGGGGGGKGGGEKRKAYGVLPHGLRIVFEDESMFIVDKPHGLPVSSSQQSSQTSSSSSPSSSSSIKGNGGRDGKGSSSSSTSSGGGERGDKSDSRVKGSEKSAKKEVSNTKTVHSIVSSFMGKRAGSSESKTFVVNRMDEDESGLVVLAKSAGVKEFLYKNWNTFGVVHNVLCEGLFFPQQGTIKTFMDDSGAAVQCSLVKGEGTKGTPAVSHYRTLESVSSPSSLLFSDMSGGGGGGGDVSLLKEIGGMGRMKRMHGENNDKTVKANQNGKSASAPSFSSFSLLEVSLETTTRDQLRAQFSYMNHSICGDYKYGPLSLLEGKEGKERIAVNEGNEISNGEEVGEMILLSDSNEAFADDNNEKKDTDRDWDNKVSLHDPIRRLGVHLSELRLTHPLTKVPLTVTSDFPASFSDLIRRSNSGSSKSLFESGSVFGGGRLITGNSGGGGSSSDSNSYDGNNRGGSKSEDEDDEDDVYNEDGQADTLRVGSQKHSQDSINDKIKVFTLTEFLGPAGKPPKGTQNVAQNGGQKGGAGGKGGRGGSAPPSGPPDGSNKFFVKKSKK